MREPIISEIIQDSIRKAAFMALRKTEEAFEKNGSLHEITHLKKNSFPTIFRSFLETEISNIAIEHEFIEASYDYISARINNLEFLTCSRRDLYRPLKNDRYDDLPLFDSCSLDINPPSLEGKSKGFLIFNLYEYQLIEISLISRTGDFSDILIYKKDRNSIILDSLSVMRDTAKKNESFTIKRQQKKEGEAE